MIDEVPIAAMIAKIRLYHFVQEKTIKEDVRELQISRNTARRVLRSGAIEPHNERNRPPLTKLETYCNGVTNC